MPRPLGSPMPLGAFTLVPAGVWLAFGLTGLSAGVTGTNPVLGVFSSPAAACSPCLWAAGWCRPCST
jgi:hypothetical protein